MGTLLPTDFSYWKHFMALWGQLKCLICITESCKSKYEAKLDKMQIFKKKENVLLILEENNI